MERPSLDDLDGALAFAQGDTLTNPSSAAAWSRLGGIHQLMAASGPGHYLEAHLAFERAYNMEPTHPLAAIGLASSAYTMGQWDMAAKLYAQAGTVEARLAEAGVLLTQGKYREGWERYEARLDTGKWKSRPTWRRPLRDLRHKTVVIRAEQAFGDNIQFSRYLPFFRGYCGVMIAEVYPPLASLITRWTGVKTVDADYEAPPDTVSVCIMSLPFLLGPEIGWDPLPYLPVIAPGPRSGIGFCSMSLPPSNGDAVARSVCRRKTPPPDLSAMLRGLYQMRSLDHDDLQTDSWLATAEIISGLDLVISVDTGVAHVAASMGIETWVLQRFDHCWRWNAGWYQDARIFKQAAPGDWVSVFRQVDEALAIRGA